MEKYKFRHNDIYGIVQSMLWYEGGIKIKIFA